MAAMMSRGRAGPPSPAPSPGRLALRPAAAWRRAGALPWCRSSTARAAATLRPRPRPRASRWRAAPARPPPAPARPRSAAAAPHDRPASAPAYRTALRLPGTFMIRLYHKRAVQRMVRRADMQAAKGEPGSWVSDEALEKFMAAYERA